MYQAKLFKSERKRSSGPKENVKEIDHLLNEEIKSKLETCDERNNIQNTSKHQLCKIPPNKHRDTEKMKISISYVTSVCGRAM